MGVSSFFSDSREASIHAADIFGNGQSSSRYFKLQNRGALIQALPAAS